MAKKYIFYWFFLIVCDEKENVEHEEKFQKHACFWCKALILVHVWFTLVRVPKDSKFYI